MALYPELKCLKKKWYSTIYKKVVVFFIYFFKVFGRHMSFFWSHWYPCFGFLVTSPLGFIARVEEANVMYIP